MSGSKKSSFSLDFFVSPALDTLGRDPAKAWQVSD